MSKPIAWGIIGLGGAGAVHYQTALASDAFEVVAVCDPPAAARLSLADGVASYDDWEAMLDHAGLEAVSICTPHFLHGPMTLAALERGLHVLLEKPPAAELAQAERIADAARDAQCVVMMEMTHRFYPAMVAAKRVLDEGRVGKLYAVEDRIVEPIGRAFPGWFVDRAKSGGGVALTNGIHMLDRIAFMTGQSLAFVSGVMGHNAGRGDVEDTAAMLLKLDDGTPVQFLAAWPVGPPPYDDELTFYGERGTLRVWSWSGWRFDPMGATGEFHPIFSPDNAKDKHVKSAFDAVFVEFADALRTGRRASPDVDDVLAAQRLVDTLYRCCRDGG
jgi:predicted dehydrogenase